MTLLTTIHPHHVRYGSAAAASLLLASLTSAAPLFSNASSTDRTDPGIATGTVTASGVVAPAGAQWSETPSVSPTIANGIAGFSCNNAGGASGIEQPFRFADDFQVDFPNVWNISTVSFYAYQPGAGATAPFDGVFVRILNGPPQLPTSTPVFGDLTTNRLLSVTPLNIYRVFNSVVGPAPMTPSTDRQLWRIDADLSPVSLSPGSYWIEWQIRATNPDAEVFCPPVTFPGSRGKPTANAQQLRAGLLGGNWVALIDLGKPSSAGDVAQDIPFLLAGEAIGPPPGCLADIAGSGPLGRDPDGVVDGADFVAFINSYGVADPAIDPLADVAGSGPIGLTPDGIIDGTDFIAFINAFAAGC